MNMISLKVLFLTSTALLHLVATQDPFWPKDFQQDGRCAVQTERGYIDLSPLDTKDPNHPRFLNVTGSDLMNSAFDYNPCTGFNVNPYVDMFFCRDVAVCQLPPFGRVYAAGDANTAQFFVSDDYGLCVKYESPVNEQNTACRNKRMTYVQLICDQREKGRLEVMGETQQDSCIYLLKLTSKYACPKGSEPGPAPGPSDPCTWWRYTAFFLVCVNSVGMITAVIAMIKRSRKPVTGNSKVQATKAEEA